MGESGTPRSLCAGQEKDKSVLWIRRRWLHGQVYRRQRSGDLHRFPRISAPAGLGISMRASDRGADPGARMLFLALFTLVIVAVNLAVLRALPLSFTPLGFVYAWLLELYILAFAYDTSQAVLCLVLSERQLSQLQSLQHHPPVALVCLTCDDFDLSILSRLGQQ